MREQALRLRGVEGPGEEDEAAGAGLVDGSVVRGEALYPELFVQRVAALYRSIAGLPSLAPCDAVNALFSRLVGLCTRPCSPSLDIPSLPPHLQDVRSRLILLCGQAEGLLEAHYSSLLAAFPQPLSHLPVFPYYPNYRKLASLEYQLLCQSGAPDPSHLAFIGSGPLPLTSIALALHHLPLTTFHNFDLDPAANALALALVHTHPDLRHRMVFHTRDIHHVTTILADYDVVFLAALVGLHSAAKADVVQHLAQHMRVGSTLVARSAHGARAFLYPVVDLHMLEALGFEVVSVFHPTDEVVNSIIIARLKSRVLPQDDDDESGHEDVDDEEVHVVIDDDDDDDEDV